VNQPATARKTINDWAADVTNNKITEVISPDTINEQTRLMLTNAVYFKGEWAHAFDVEDTSPEKFFLTPDKSIEVPMMSQRGEFGYAHADGVRVLVMPYRGDELSMVCILPDKKDGLAELESRLDGKTLSQWTASAVGNTVELPVEIPKFKFENAHDLEPALAAMGITAAFDSATADFSRIDGVKPVAGAVNRLFVDQVFQNALIDVNEEGTEAAAVTTMTVTESKEVREAPRFRADHPFLFLIQENETGLILFIGRVVDPSAK
jgi:serpin B